MSDPFDDIINDVKLKFEDLKTCPKFCIKPLPKNMPHRGVYLFSEKDLPLYIGRTNSLRWRLQQHTRNNHHQATFAFLLARHQTGILKPSYQPNGSRQDLLTNPIFRDAFDAARQRIREMDVEFVGELDPIKQTLLEVFAAFQTKARFNDFDNH